MKILRNKMLSILFILFVILTCLFTGCNSSGESECDWSGYPESNSDMASIAQGIWGDVWLWIGDFQPICPTGKITPMVREVRIYELTTLDDVDTVDSLFYENIRTELLVSVWSNDQGFFEIELAPLNTASLWLKTISVMPIPLTSKATLLQ